MEARVKLVKELDEFEATHRELKRGMDIYKASGKDNWNDFKETFSSRIDDLDNSLNDFFSTSGTTITLRNQP